MYNILNIWKQNWNDVRKLIYEYIASCCFNVVKCLKNNNLRRKFLLSQTDVLYSQKNQFWWER